MRNELLELEHRQQIMGGDDDGAMSESSYASPQRAVEESRRSLSDLSFQ